MAGRRWSEAEPEGMEAADPDLPDAAVEHISHMLTLAKSKHQEAMALLGTPDPSAVPRLREVLRLLEEVELLADDPIYAAKAQALSERTYEFNQFLVDVLGVTDLKSTATDCVAYHASCHGLRGLGLINQPQQLLDQVEGIEQKALAGREECCGFGGLFAVKMSQISGAILQRKLENIEASGAETIVGTDVSCLMHIAGGLQRRGSSIQVKHIADILRSER